MIDEFQKSFELYLAHIRKKADGTSMVVGTVSGHRSAVTYLFTCFGKTFSPEFEKRLTTFFKGLSRVTAQEKQSGIGKVKEGKDAMQFALYQFISLYLLQRGTRDNVFMRTFMILSWNLMCRASNTETICFSHMEWIEDALGVYFAHQKNDQEGTRPKDPRHIYANPAMPAICPILALGIYFLTHPIDATSKKLFPGAGQYDRYQKELGNLFAEATMKAELERYGISGSDLGSHSTRKGSTTFSCSGSTACPSITAIQLRAGWKLEGVTERYIRYADAGDQHVGRTVTGLSADSADFALLPPYFPTHLSAIDEAIDCCFRGPPTMQRIFEFCLASVVWHSDYLHKTLPPNAPLFANPLFTQAHLLQQLRTAVKCHIGNGTECIRATGPLLLGCDIGAHPLGIPPGVKVLVKLDALAGLVERMGERMEAIPNETVQGVVKELEDRAISARTVTTDGLGAAISSALAPLMTELHELRTLHTPLVAPAARPPYAMPAMPAFADHL